MDLLNHILSCQFVCPQERSEKDKESGKVITLNRRNYYIIKSSYLLDEDEDVHSLLRRNKEEGEDEDHCNACSKHIIGNNNTYYYFCEFCQSDYHKECVESPSVFHSTDHPKHPLQLLWSSRSYYFQQKQCCSCGDPRGYQFYYCYICDFIIHSSCARNPAPLTIDNLKRHEHTLHYFPRRSALVCDVCGLEDDIGYLYVCFLCDFIVHKHCVYLPYVIKVSRHDHRLAFTPNNIPYKEWTDCGVCHAKINGNYGKYSCIKGCAYAVYSKCAMRKDICDGKELEGELEEAYENIKMFKDEGKGMIRHLSHPRHQIRLEKKIQRVYDDENKHCQACNLPFNNEDGNVYQCVQCDFALHESCAHSPRVKQSILHVHPMNLEVDHTTSWLYCRKCHRYSCGFRYVCRLKGCDVELDILCASTCEPFDYHSHPHPLFITYDDYTMKQCSICRSKELQPLNCVKCDFVLCFHCATLPHKARYEHDEHFLIFSYVKEENDKDYWCEICEKNILPKKGLYKCNECEVTLHIKCLLGRDPYMVPGKNFTLSSKEMVHVLSKARSTRPICKTCHKRRPYKTRIESSRYGVFCSIDCCRNYVMEIGR